MWIVTGTASVCLVWTFLYRPFVSPARIPGSFGPFAARPQQLPLRKPPEASRLESSSSSCPRRSSRTVHHYEFQNKFPRDRVRRWSWHHAEPFHTPPFAADHASAVPKMRRYSWFDRRATCRRAYTGTHPTRSEGCKHSRDRPDASAWQNRNRLAGRSRYSPRSPRNCRSGTTRNDSAGRVARAASGEAPSCGRIVRTPDTFPAETRRECRGYALATCLPGLRSGTLHPPKSPRTSALLSSDPEEWCGERARHFPASSADGGDAGTGCERATKSLRRRATQKALRAPRRNTGSPARLAGRGRSARYS